MRAHPRLWVESGLENLGCATGPDEPYGDDSTMGNRYHVSRIPIFPYSHVPRIPRNSPNSREFPIPGIPGIPKFPVQMNLRHLQTRPSILGHSMKQVLCLSWNNRYLGHLRSLNKLSLGTEPEKLFVTTQWMRHPQQLLGGFGLGEAADG